MYFSLPPPTVLLLWQEFFICSEYRSFLRYVCFANTFSQPVAYLFISLVHYEKKYFFILIKFLSLFYMMITFCVLSTKSLPNCRLQDTLLVFFSKTFIILAFTHYCCEYKVILCLGVYEYSKDIIFMSVITPFLPSHFLEGDI